MSGATHTHDGVHQHTHEFNAAEHGHSHEILDGPGSYLNREMPIVEGRNWADRAFTIGIGGYVIMLISMPLLSPLFISPSSPLVILRSTNLLTASLPASLPVSVPTPPFLSPSSPPNHHRYHTMPSLTNPTPPPRAGPSDPARPH